MGKRNQKCKKQEIAEKVIGQNYITSRYEMQALVKTFYVSKVCVSQSDLIKEST